MSIVDIKNTLKTDAKLDPYRLYNSYDPVELAKQLQLILNDTHELKEIERNELYKTNIVDTAQFVYLKFLSERKAEVKMNKRTARPSLFSSKSLQTLYSFAA